MVQSVDSNSVGSTLRFTIADTVGQRIPNTLRDYLLLLNSRNIEEIRNSKPSIVAEIKKYQSVFEGMLNQHSQVRGAAITDELLEIWVNAAVVNGETPQLNGLGDVVEKALSTFGVTKERYARVTGKKKGCSGCSQRQARLNRLVPFHRQDKPGLDRMQFLYCYFHNGAKQDELRWSMRAIDSYYQGEASFLVIGDKPPWYDGPYIEHPRVRRATGFRRGLRDVLWKMNTVQNHPLVADEFFWMMDDVFLLRPITKEELVVPRAFGRIRENRANGWRSVKSNTSSRLRDLGLPQRDYATHLGHHIVKDNLQELFKTWDPVEEVFLWEVAYGNTFHSDPAPAAPYLRRFKRRGNAEIYYRFSKTSAFLNVYSAAWCQPLRNWLHKKFPEPHVGEVGNKPTVNLTVKDTTPIDHYLLVKAEHSANKENKECLRLTKQMCVPSIISQYDGVKVVVSLSASDPLHDDRKQVFRDAIADVRFVYDQKWNLPGNQRLLISRCDDANALSSDFCGLTWQAACTVDSEMAVLQWPKGYVRAGNGKLRRIRQNNNEFWSLITHSGNIAQPWEPSQMNASVPTIIVNNSRGWIWNEKGREIQGSKDRWTGKVADPPNINRWAFSWK